MKNTDTREINWDLLAKYLDNEASDDEVRYIEQWLSSNEANQQLLIRIKKGMAVMQRDKFDTNQAWHTVEARLDMKQKPGSKSVYWPIRIAAAILILISTTYLLYQFNPLVTTETQWITSQTGDSIDQFVLPDGSVAYLNKNSRLTYPAQFNDSIREVTLEGEAFFEVSKMENKPFVLSTIEIQVRVLGTSFNVNAYSGKNVIDVTVRSGLVEVLALNNLASESKVLLSKGEVATLENNSTLTKNINKDENYLAWRTGILQFNETLLPNVIKTINKYFGAEVSLGDNKLSSCRLTARFDNKSLKEVVQILSTTFNLTVVQKHNQIILDGKSCM